MVEGGEDALALCVEILKEGYADAFVQFYDLAHKDPPSSNLVSKKQQLMEAEESVRMGRHEAACRSYLSLAESYAAAGDLGTAMSFHEKVLEICNSAQDMVGASEAQGRLGRNHMAQGNILDAIRCHEQQVAVALSIGPDAVEQKRDGQSSLVVAYTAQATDYEASGDSGSAIALYEKCLDSARASGDIKGEGETQHRMGNTLANIGEVDRAMQSQRLYRDACAAQSPVDIVGQGRACQALATAAQSLGDIETASKYLEECVELASSAEDSAAQARACAALGGLHRSQGNHGEFGAVQCTLERF
jgi:tetratricopeptide (TPR) repeat protein